MLILGIFPTTGSKGPVQKKMRFFDFFQSPSVDPKILSKVCGDFLGTWRRYLDSLDTPDSNLNQLKRF